MIIIILVFIGNEPQVVPLGLTLRDSLKNLKELIKISWHSNNRTKKYRIKTWIKL